MGSLQSTRDFEGLYAGLGTGMTTLLLSYHSDFALFTSADTYVPGSKKFHSSNAATMFDAQIGYGKFITPNIYLGMKGIVDYTPIESFTTYPVNYIVGSGFSVIASSRTEVEIKPIYNIDAVLGYEIYPHLLAFVEGGVNFTDVSKTHKLSLQTLDLTTLNLNQKGGYASLNDYKTGGNAGIGVGYQLPHNWIISGEILYHYLGHSSDSIPGFFLPINTDSSSQLVTLLVNASYLF